MWAGFRTCPHAIKSCPSCVYPWHHAHNKCTRLSPTLAGRVWEPRAILNKGSPNLTTQTGHTPCSNLLWALITGPNWHQLHFRTCIMLTVKLLVIKIIVCAVCFQYPSSSYSVHVQYLHSLSPLPLISRLYQLVWAYKTVYILKRTSRRS